MSVSYLIKPGELTLKGNNRKIFEDALKRNLQRMLGGVKAKIKKTSGRFFLECGEEHAEIAENCLSHLIGISGWAKTTVCKKSIEDIMTACVEEAKIFAQNGIKTFKIKARRTDKAFPLDSYGVCCRAGEAVLLSQDGMKVDIHNPQGIINIEIREKTYIYTDGKKGLGGLPVGCAGKGLLLLSGGIDSPVAGFLMACRGMGIEAIHFHAYPYTSIEAKEKVIRLAQIAGSYCMGIKLYILNFTQVQQRIKERSPAEWTTVILRMAMMEAAEKAANKIKCKCLITGESLSQVASQTIENLRCTESRIALPVLRPLIGMDKETIIKKAQKLGTYEVSILPFADCCTLFSPAHPILRGDPEQAEAIYESLEIEGLIEEALNNYEVYD